MVYQRKWCSCLKKCQHSKRWWYDFSLRGKRYRKSVAEARTKGQAEQAETRARNDVFDGKYGKDESGVRLLDFIEEVYKPYCLTENRSHRSCFSRLKRITEHFRNVRMRDVTLMQVRAFRRALLTMENPKARNRRYSPHTVDLIIANLARIYSLAIGRELISFNPCKGIERAKAEILTDYMTAEEEAKLWPHLSGRRAFLVDILEIDLFTGMRKSEVMKLHKDQVEFSHDRIVLKKTKNGKARVIPIHEALRPTLERLVRDAGPNGYLFESKRTGRPVSNIDYLWKKALEDAGLRHIRFHVAGRHTFGTRAVANGASLKDVQEILGHADIKMTMRYVHATEQGKKRAVAAAIAARPSNIVTFPVQGRTGTDG